MDKFYYPLPSNNAVDIQKIADRVFLYPNSPYFRSDIYTTDEYYIFHYRKPGLIVQNGSYCILVPDVKDLLRDIVEGRVISEFTPSARREIAYYESKFYDFLYKIWKEYKMLDFTVYLRQQDVS